MGEARNVGGVGAGSARRGGGSAPGRGLARLRRASYFAANPARSLGLGEISIPRMLMCTKAGAGRRFVALCELARAAAQRPRRRPLGCRRRRTIALALGGERLVDRRRGYGCLRRQRMASCLRVRIRRRPRCRPRNRRSPRSRPRNRRPRPTDPPRPATPRNAPTGQTRNVPTGQTPSPVSARSKIRTSRGPCRRGSWSSSGSCLWSG